MTPMDLATDDVVARLRAGDREALAAFFARHRERLGRVVAFRLDPRLRRRLDVDDVLQQAYLDADQRLAHCRAATAVEAFTWLRLILGQTLADVHRAHLGVQARDAGREVSLEGSGHDATSVCLARQLIGPNTSPSGAAVRSEAVARLEAALARLGPVDREILALRHFEELQNSEVAAMLALDPKAASIRYVRALARLKAILAELSGG